eukprot:jgi/Tetstr1/425191/TSEL_015652.t1
MAAVIRPEIAASMEAAVERKQARQQAGEELPAQEAAVEQHQAGHWAGEELPAEEAAQEQPQSDEEDMPLSDEYDSDFVAEGSAVDDDIAEIVLSAPPERDEAMFADNVKHVQTYVEERIEQTTWGGEQYRVVPPAVDSEIGQVLKTLQLLDPTL